MTDREQYLRSAQVLDVRDKAAFSRMVRDGRRLAGLSLRGTARELGADARTVSRWEDGVAAPALMARRTVIDRFVQLLGGQPSAAPRADGSWLETLPPAARARFWDDIDRVVAHPDRAEIIRTVRAWKAAAAIYADPQLRLALSGPLAGSFPGLV